MRCLRQAVRLLLIVQFLLRATCESLNEGAELSLSQTNQVGGGGEELADEPVREESPRKEEQGSWSQWWSYYGISGPDYWSINKPWQVCGWGRKQSPVEVRTSRLLYDHTLGPFRLTWLPSGAQLDESIALASEQQQQQQQQTEQPAGQNQANQNQADDIIKQQQQQQQQRPPVRLRLLNSGRGVEAWFEPSHQQQQQQQQQRAKQTADEQAEEELVLSHGPLSYAYKLFKIELHSSASYSAPQTRPPATPSPGERPEEESVPEALATAKSSEHLIDGRAFDGELQLHFYNKRLAASAAHALRLAEAQASGSLFASISVLLLAQSEPNSKRNNQSGALDFLLDNLGAIPDQGNSVELRLARRHIEALVPERGQYITYEGSLNRPPCSESVDWILVNRALRVRAEKFRALFDKLNTNQENVRPIKPLFRRTMRTTISGLRREQEKQQQQQQLRVAELESCAEAGDQSAADRVRNCTTARQQLEFVANRSNAHLDSLSAKQPWTHEQPNEANSNQCSMKPHYVYQLTYSG